MPDPRDEFTCLCEACGYVIEGLPPEGACPECGRAIAESSPALRPGSPWQQNPGPAAWWRTVGLILRHPIGAWGIVRIEPARAGPSLINLSLAGFLIALVAATRFTREAYLARAGAGADQPRVWLWAGWFIFFWLAGVIGLAILTQIENRGVRFFGNRRGWRVTPAVADTVCAHATAGWLIAALLWGACALAVDTGLARRLVAALGIPRPPPSVWLRGISPLAGFLVGLMVFEFLVYFGARRNRFANRERPDAVQVPPHR